MTDLTPISALLVDVEAAHMDEQYPTLRDTLFEQPILATIIEMLVNDVYAFSERKGSEPRVAVLDASVMCVRLGAWRKKAMDALAITEPS